MHCYILTYVIYIQNNNLLTTVLFSVLPVSEMFIPCSSPSIFLSLLTLQFYIYDYSHVVAMHIIKKASEVDGIKLEILR